MAPFLTGFLSTPSARRATTTSPSRERQLLISIHALREEGDAAFTSWGGGFAISIHALREEGDPTRSPSPSPGNIFLSTPSARRATQPHRGQAHGNQISIHALREEGDAAIKFFELVADGFLSTPSARRATDAGRNRRFVGGISIHALREEGDASVWSFTAALLAFLSTPSARRATGDPGLHRPGPGISIHALREEGDPRPRRPTTTSSYFYPRPPRGGRPRPQDRERSHSRFLSTPSARRATRRSSSLSLLPTDFYPRPPRGGRRLLAGRVPTISHFYPRPPRGGRQDFIRVSNNIDQFLSTPSARRATRGQRNHRLFQGISIHALREEGDGDGLRGRKGQHYFYPRPPRGGRPPTSSRKRGSRRYFYPRPPRGGRLYYFNVPCRILWISIHALREEGDPGFGWLCCCGFSISIHALREEGDLVLNKADAVVGVGFLSTPSARRATLWRAAEHSGT